MPLTTNPNDPHLGHGVDATPRPQQDVYLVLSDAERAQGFVRPVRKTYRHVGPSEAKNKLRDLTDEEHERYGKYGYVKFEEYPPGDIVGKFWTQADLDNVGKGCGYETTMADAIAETYARDPRFYGATYCVFCQRHLPVDEFVWINDGTRVGS